MGNQKLSTSDSKSVKEAITEFYNLAGIQPPVIDGDVSEKTAEIFYQMYNAAATCSSAMDLVPRPSGGPPGIVWIVTQLTGAVIRRHKGKLTYICILKAINNWRSALVDSINNS